MITSVKIEDFRGVREGGVEGLAPISILVGPNNSGKSTALEAIAAVGMGTDAPAIAKLLMRRGGPPLDALARAMSRSTKRATITIARSTEEQVEEWRTKISIRDDLPAQLAEEARRVGLQEPMEAFVVEVGRGHQSNDAGVYVDAKGLQTKRIAYSVAEAPLTRFVDVEAVRGTGALEDAYTRIDEAGQLGNVIKSLARSMAGLADLRILKVGSDFVLHAFSESGPPIPAYLAGDGFKRFLELAAAAVSTPKGCVLLEEPEAYQHPRYLQELATLLHLAARQGTQIILSTHSLELIDFLLLAPEAEGQTYPAVHRMTLHEGKLRATTVDRESAVVGRESLLEDLRA